MKRMVLIASASILLATQAEAQKRPAVHPQAEAAAAIAPPAKTAQDLAAELAAVLSPPDMIRQNIRRSAANSIDQGLAQDPNLPPAEKMYPGLSRAMKDAALAAVEPVINEACLDLARRQRNMLAQSFTVQELRQVVTFYRSPAALQGTAEALAAARNSLDPSKKQSLQKRAGEGQLSGGDVEAITSPVTTARISPSAGEAYLRFSTTPVAHKVSSVTPAFEALIAQWVNDYAPRLQSTIRDTMTAKAASYIASRK